MLPSFPQLSWRKQECVWGVGKEDLILRQVALEGPEDSQGTSSRQVDVARGEIRHPDVVKRWRLYYFNSSADSS